MIPARHIDVESLRIMFERCLGISPFKLRRQIDKLEKAYRNGKLFIPPDEPENQKWWRCETRMLLGHYEDWSGWEYRDEWAATLWHHKPYPVKPWNGLKTDVLYIIGEQGVGDEILFASCLADCFRLAGKVIIETVPRLRKVFERMGCEVVEAELINNGLTRMRKDLPQEVTAWMALGDLPRMFRLALEHFPGTPYITADPEQIERFSAYKGMTGISWRGAQGTVESIKQIQGVSLQYDQSWDEDVTMPHDLNLRDDIEGVLGLIANLDKVVTVSTSVAHFSAAMGKETHVYIADPKTATRSNVFPWKWVCRKTPGRTPWYKSAIVYENSHHRPR